MKIVNSNNRFKLIKSRIINNNSILQRKEFDLRPVTYYELDNSNKDDNDARLVDTINKLKNNTTSVELVLYNCIVHSEGARVLGSWLERNTTQRLLNLWGCSFKDKAFSLFCASLAQNITLVELSVSCTFFLWTNAQMANIFKAKHENRIYASSSDRLNIASFIKQNHSLTKVVLHHIGLDSEGVKLVAESLKNNSSLTHLDISMNNIGNEGASWIAESLKHNSSLIRLDIRRNNIGSKGAKEIAESLKLNLSLAYLDIGGNIINDEGAQCIAEMIEENQSLTKLYLNSDRISTTGEIAIRKATKLNGRIGEIGFHQQLEKFQPINPQEITLSFAVYSEALGISSCISSAAEQMWCDRINFVYNNDINIGKLSIKTAILQDIFKSELKVQTTKFHSPATILLDGANSAVASALSMLNNLIYLADYFHLVTDLKRPFIVLPHTYDYKSLLSLLHKATNYQLIVLIQNVTENIEAFKSFLQQVKDSKIQTKCLTVIGIAEESSHDTKLFDCTIKVRFNSSRSIYEYLMATVYMSKHSIISMGHLQSLAERFADCKKERGSGLFAPFKVGADVNLSPTDIDSIFIEASILSLSRGLNIPSVTLADVESVLESSKTIVYQGKPKLINEAIAINPQEYNVMKEYFNFVLRQHRIYVEWINDITEQLTVNVAKLIGLHYEILKHLQSINVPQHQIRCYRLRVNCDTWTWKLGVPVVIKQPLQQEKDDTLVTETREMLLEKENEYLREEMKHVEKYKQEYNAALRLVKTSISDFPYDELMFEEQIGEGSFGNVRRALWHNQKVAVKRFKLDSIDSPMTVLGEAKTLAHVRHKHIVLLMGTTTIPGTNETMLVLEYMKHGSLHDLLVKKKVKLERGEIIQLATDIAKGLDHLHSMTPKIIHRDLKPQNILLYQKGKRAKLTDFGTAKWFNRDTILSSGVGTIGFMAPEVLAWDPNYNEKVDIFSFGVVLLQMVSGQGMPVTKEKAREQHVNNAIKSPTLADLKQLVIECCKEDPKKRPSVSDIVKRLKSMK